MYLHRQGWNPSQIGLLIDMYEKLVIPAIQHTKEKGFQMRYRLYSSESERDTIFDILEAKDDKKDPISKVTLIITVDPVVEQISLEL